MGRSRKLRRGRAVAALVAGTMLVSGCGPLATEPEPEAVLVGVDLALTGAGSELGVVYQTALQLRVDQINQQRALGDRQLELVVLDNRSDEATAVQNMTELADRSDITAIIAGGCDECALAAIGDIEQAGVPTIVLGFAAELVEPVAERRFLFKIGPNASHNASVLVGELQRSGAESVALVTSDDPYGVEGETELTQAADRNDLEVLLSESISGQEGEVPELADAIVEIGAPDSQEGEAQQGEPEEGELEPEPTPGQQEEVQQEDQQLPDAPEPGDAETAQPDGPDAVVMWAPEQVSLQLAAALREQGYEGDLLLDASAAGSQFVHGDASDALDGARMVFTETLVIDDVIATSPAKAARQNWFRDYTTQEGNYHAYSAFAADAVQVLADALPQTGSPDRESMRDAIEGTALDGFSGRIRFRLESHSGLSQQALTVLVAQGDRWRLAAGG